MPEEMLIDDSPPGMMNFTRFWKDFSAKFNAVDTAAIKMITPDSIWLWGDRTSRKDFITRYATSYTAANFRGLLDTTIFQCEVTGCNPSLPLADLIPRRNTGYRYNCWKVTTINDTVNSTVEAIIFRFAETTKGYRLEEINYGNYYLIDDKPLNDTIPKHK